MKCAKYAALLSGDVIDVALFEIEQYALARGKRFSVVWHKGRMAVFEADEGIDFSGIALSSEVALFFGESVEEIDFSELEPHVCVKGVKVTPDARVSDIERKAGGAITREGLKVDQSSDCVLRIYGVNDKHVFGRILFAADRKEMMTRDAKNRPYFSAGTINAKLARGFVNLGRVSSGDSVLDPFCGSGAFLIEAGLIGCKVFGCEISEEHAHGARVNLEHYGVRNHDIRVMDALECRRMKKKFDCVVTDLPWGKSTLLSSEKPELYRKFMEMLPEILKKKRFAVIASDSPGIWYPEALCKVREFETYVHKSKKRHVNVFFLP